MFSYIIKYDLVWILDLSQETKDQLLDYVEKYAMTCLYRVLFCPQSTNDEEKDLQIQKR